jgi:hypothetical protein
MEEPAAACGHDLEWLPHVLPTSTTGDLVVAGKREPARGFGGPNMIGS